MTAFLEVSMDSPHLTFRQANIDDLTFIKELSLRVFSIFGPYDSILSQKFPNPEVITLISEIGEIKCGFAMLELLRGPNLLPIWGEMIAIAVEPCYQGKKIGGGLLSKIEELASTYGLRYLNLHVASDNLRALECFQKRGYKILESISAYYPQGQKALHMARAIPPDQGGHSPFTRTG
jgi:ribosomal protein S18 acetylase RimI-like enzyme